MWYTFYKVCEVNIMEKVIKIDLYNKKYFFEKYNESAVSRNLINYLVEQAIYIDKNDTIKVIVNDRCEFGEDCLKIIKDGLELEYQKNLKNCKLTNIKQVTLMFLGVLILFLSTIIQGMFVFDEVFLIIGWVPIWEAVDIELFSDVKEKKKRKILKKILEGKFELVYK